MMKFESRCRGRILGPEPKSPPSAHASCYCERSFHAPGGWPRVGGSGRILWTMFTMKGRAIGVPTRFGLGIREARKVRGYIWKETVCYSSGRKLPSLNLMSSASWGRVNELPVVDSHGNLEFQADATK